jgi:citrate synthase
MKKECRVKNTGLRGVTVADTKISFIDGERGVLIYRGYRIEELARLSTFEEVVYLLLRGEIPNPESLSDFRKILGEKFVLPDFLLETMKIWPAETGPMQALMASVAMLGFTDRTVDNESVEEHQTRAIRLVAALPAVLVAWDRIRRGVDPETFSPGFSIAENILYGICGEDKDPDDVRCLDVCLILHADHSFNASTFACREVASTRADMYAGVLAGIGALSGLLHGGANEKVMEMLLRLQHEPDVAGWVDAEVENGRKIMGMGHAVYKTVDPRAVFLREMAKDLGEKNGEPHWSRLLEEIERAAIGKFESLGKTGIRSNVDFYSAPVYHLLGFPQDLFTPIFAVSRVAGWCAHIIEEKFSLAQPKAALYRPSAEYIGNYCGLMGCTYDRSGREE